MKIETYLQAGKNPERNKREETRDARKTNHLEKVQILQSRIGRVTLLDCGSKRSVLAVPQSKQFQIQPGSEKE